MSRDEVEVEYRLWYLVRDGAQLVTDGGKPVRGALLAAMTLANGAPFEWDPPATGPQFPAGFEVEFVEMERDGRVVARGHWPNLDPLPPQ